MQEQDTTNARTKAEKKAACQAKWKAANKEHVREYQIRWKAKRKQHVRDYTVWRQMIIRCHNDRCPEYRYYGGRGIQVCERWRESLANFIADMGHRPAGLEIDRINNDKGYEPGNCRWATRKEQCRNRRSSRIIVANGISRTAAEWSELTGIPSMTIRSRIDKWGWTPERSVSEGAKS